ncbi:MscS Mechanosensitive ion channel [Methanolacinia petrolearia DSM 11571]|uniref:MscS Mechanosensitive ion channel n=1 Tax=Methanolacinia petrolearia (strain DSM 11571 / OCM 486 / SEBR 4847) TaxID=679926 RepID=E1REV2_METP4|nr:mechanosensitive ion channel domain-containing protein [Methanolacinia petrolearia]ADN36123.1 MscS Mechanosensitive ion channel [Methanolacinia petrolearia DSM 11571]
MRSSALPFSYFIIVALIFASVIAIDLVTSGTISLFTPLLDTLGIILIILVAYTAGVAVLIHRIADDSSRFTAVRIFMTVLLGIGAFLALTAWIDDPKEIALTLGVIVGAVLIALRDFIQNMIGSLMVLVTGIFRIGDRIQIRGVYGLVMDIGVFRTTLMKLDPEAGDHPTGEIVTIPNGIIFKENVTNTTRHLSVVTDEIRITLPFSADLEKARDVLVGAIRKHTMEIEKRARDEISKLSEKKFLHSFDVEPVVNLQMSDNGIVFILKYFTTSKDRAALKTAIIRDVSATIPEIKDTGEN